LGGDGVKISRADLTPALIVSPYAGFAAMGIKPDPWQERIAHAAGKSNLLVVAPRQSGKTSAAAIVALRTALITGGTVLVAAPTERQSTEFVLRVERLAANLGAKIAAQGRTYMELASGGRVIALPENPEGIRGYSASLVVIDEAAYTSKELYVALRPMLAATGGSILAISTPAGRIGWFWGEWERGEGWERIRVTAYDVGRYTPEFLERERAALGEVAFNREYMAAFTDDVEGALWSWAWFDRPGFRVKPSEAPPFKRVVVGVDPAIGSGTTGIVVAALGEDGDYYVLGDHSAPGTPTEAWVAAVVRAYETHGADAVIVEVNAGGDLVRAAIRHLGGDLPIREVRATRGKAPRAEPIAILYEAGRVHHVGRFPALEEQMATWTGRGESPDRLDALVWALTALKSAPRGRMGVISWEVEP